jgi:hypothetical protein
MKTLPALLRTIGRCTAKEELIRTTREDGPHGGLHQPASHQRIAAPPSGPYRGHSKTSRRNRQKSARFKDNVQDKLGWLRQ